MYEWVIEFQCVKNFDDVWFVGINWYSCQNKVSNDYYQNLLTATKKQDLGEKGDGVYRINQTNCTYAH